MLLVPLPPTPAPAHLLTPRLPEPPVEVCFASRLTERQVDQAWVERQRADYYRRSFRPAPAGVEL